MKRRLCLAALLALVLFLTAAFALAEEISVEQGSVPEPESDGLYNVEIDAMPPISEALEWEGPAGSDQNDAANTSKPSPKYEPETYEIVLSGDTIHTLMIGDQLIVTVPGKTIRSYKSSDEDVVTLVYDPEFGNCLNVFPMAVGKAKVTVKLNDGTTYATVGDPLSPVSLARREKSDATGGPRHRPEAVDQASTPSTRRRAIPMPAPTNRWLGWGRTASSGP